MTVRTGLGLGCAAVAVAFAFVTSERVATRPIHRDRITVVYWEKWTGSEGEEMRKTVDAFNASQDRIFVRYLSISSVDSKTMLATAGGDPPDVTGPWADNIPQFADAHALLDLTAMCKEAGIKASDYIAGYWDMLNYRGGLWALPSTPASTAMHVNADLVPPEYRSPETFPHTFEDLDKLVARISRKDSRGRLIVAGFLPSEPGWWNWAWGYYYGGTLLEGGRPTLDTPQNLRAFEWLAGYARKFGSREVQSFQSGFGGSNSPQDAFMDGKVASELHGVYKANSIRLYRPRMNWFALPMPHPADRPDLADRSALGMDVLGIPSGSKHPKEAFEFIRYVQRQDVMESLCARHGKNSPLAKVSERFFDGHINKYIRLFDRLARSPGAFHGPLIGIWPQISSEMSAAVQAVNAGLKTPKQALRDAQSRVDRLWAIYKRQVLGQP